MVSSPLRYPGGKAKLYNCFTDIIKKNNLFSSTYCEPYAGGAGLALMLLSRGFVDRIKLNDIDQGIYAFWWSILSQTNKFCSKIEETPIDIDEWYIQRDIWREANIKKPLELGFATYYLNRTNRSGIIDGAGPIGGLSQVGIWKIDARLNKQKQISNIQMVAKYKSKIELSNLDALKFISENIKEPETFMYLDPPYYVKGQNLYKNFYIHKDHEAIASKLQKERNKKWVVSYDDVPEIRKIYSNFVPVSYGLNYSAGKKGIGKEVMYFSDTLEVPEIKTLKNVS